MLNYPNRKDTVKMREKNGEHPWGDTGQLLLLGLFLVLWAGDSFFLRQSTFLAGFIPLAIRLAVLILAFIIGFYLFKSGHVVVSHGQRPTGVVSNGAFRYVRHPLYLASLLAYLGLSFSTVSLLSFTLLIVIFVFYNSIASYEEKLLENKHDDAYRQYKKKTAKWIPRRKNA